VSIDVGGLQIAELRIVGVNGTPGIGFHRLQFTLEISFPATPNRTIELGSLTGFVYAGISQGQSAYRTDASKGCADGLRR